MLGTNLNWGEQEKPTDRKCRFPPLLMGIAHWKLGEKEKARQWYDRAAEWMDKNQAKLEVLRRFRAEAAELLGLNEKK